MLAIINNKTENLKREHVLSGKTYTLKSQLLKHTLYITINNYENKPFELFFNTKDTSKFIELQILSRLISSIFRRTLDARFVIDELKSINNPENTGYFRPPRKNETKGKYIPSLYFEIGEILEYHIKENFYF